MTTIGQLITWLRRRGGAAHTGDAGRAGFSSHRIRVAVQSGAVHRVRRSWLVLPDCDPQTRAAVAVGGRLTCVSAAARAGWWTPSITDVHVSVAPSASRFARTGLMLHWARGPFPAVRAPVDPPINVLFHVARCQPRPLALAVWESALRTNAVDAAELRAVDWRCTAARELASVASVLSDSGLESIFVDLMTHAGVTLRQQVWLDGHPVDTLIGDWLVVQLDGFAHHSTAADRRRDIEADARLALRGYTVLRFDYQQVLFDQDHVVQTVLTAIAQGLHRTPRGDRSLARRFS